MRVRFVIAVLLALISFSFTPFLGCGGKSQVCSVSPIDIEEVRSDARDLVQDRTAAQARLKDAQDDLAEWQARLAKRRSELPELKAELERQKKMSGVTEEMVAAVKPKPQTEEDIQIRPREE